MWAWLSSVQSGQSFIFSFVGERKFALKETDVERGREREREKVGEREREREREIEKVRESVRTNVRRIIVISHLNGSLGKCKL